MTFKEYIKYKSPVGSIRAKNAILKNNLKGKDNYDTLVLKGGIGRKTIIDILNLQRKYLKIKEEIKVNR